MEASITLKKVGKLVGDKTILAGLTFGIEKGTIVAMVGDNDAGKSTLLRLIAGLENPNYGSVFLHGLDTDKRRLETRQTVAFVPHDIDLDPWLTLEQNIHFDALLYGAHKEKIQSRIQEYSSALELGDFLYSLAGRVPQGIQKKAMIIRALAHDPTILIMDEPTAFMDAESRRLTWNLMRKIKGDTTIVYSSQFLPEVEATNDRIMVIHDGRVLLDGSLDKLLESTLEYHQFDIEFEDLSEELFKSLCAVVTVVNPTKVGNTFHFYGRSRKVFFEVLNACSGAPMKDLSIEKLSLQDLLDSAFAQKGMDG
ncbi:MAG TPA: ABC transporter ATP-binding protein [Candidatus Marinimicrobia bacterium]|jgi:ABC-type multidrug transport system ATPase subunit|nr:ABC transporter ATP-binding protein [Candidatus Neomarinimicrobiota bacterium]MDP7217231.1 ABC transporter ATP-binding protein [Candidatus Neomarinimicrobiota bacterium]HJM69558.1 ABC transporter ATP-binding protein [Candidatus Neomarinimicrobiota bacterium]